MSPLHLVYGCPAWCAVDHTVPDAPGLPVEPADEAVHVGKTIALQAPNGRRVMEAELTLAPDNGRPTVTLVLDGLALDEDVLELDAVQTAALVARLQSFTDRLQNTLPVLEGRKKRAKPGAKQRRSGGYPNPGKHQRAGWRETRLYLAERDGRHCHYCRTPFDTLKGVSVDHYVPYSLWPTNLPANLVLACQPCNTRKNDALPRALAALLLTGVPEVPEGEVAA